MTLLGIAAIILAAGFIALQAVSMYIGIKILMMYKPLLDKGLVVCDKMMDYAVTTIDELTATDEDETDSVI